MHNGCVIHGQMGKYFFLCEVELTFSFDGETDSNTRANCSRCDHRHRKSCTIQTWHGLLILLLFFYDWNNWSHRASSAAMEWCTAVPKKASSILDQRRREPSFPHAESRNPSTSLAWPSTKLRYVFCDVSMVDCPRGRSNPYVCFGSLVARQYPFIATNSFSN